MPGYNHEDFRVTRCTLACRGSLAYVNSCLQDQSLTLSYISGVLIPFRKYHKLHLVYSLAALLALSVWSKLTPGG